MTPMIRSAFLNVLGHLHVWVHLKTGAALARCSYYQNGGNPQYHTGDNLFPWTWDTFNARRVFFLKDKNTQQPTVMNVKGTARARKIQKSLAILIFDAASSKVKRFIPSRVWFVTSKWRGRCRTVCGCLLQRRLPVDISKSWHPRHVLWRYHPQTPWSIPAYACLHP